MPTRSLWLQEALAAEDGVESSELTEPIRADVCVVGGGYTGLWTALRIAELEPDASIALVEAGICGGGPSGRNGGFALSWWPKVETLIKRTGEEEAFRLVRASAAAVDELGAFCEREGIDAHFRRGGWLWTATSPAQVGAWEGAVAAASRAGERPFEVLSAEEVQRRTGSPVHLGAAYEAGAATVQPALLARGLRRVAAERGVRVFERSPLVELDRERGIARTPAGSVEAGAIVLATGAWLAGIPELKRAVVAVSSDMIATAPMPERLEEAGWTGGESISNCRLMVHYYRTTSDGRIAFGQGGHRHVFGGRVDDELLGTTPEDARAHPPPRPRSPRPLRGRRRRDARLGRADRPDQRRRADLRAASGTRADRLCGRLLGQRRRAQPDGGKDPRLERARPRRRMVGLRAQPRGDREVPAGADPLLRRLRRPRGGEAQGDARGRRPRSVDPLTRRVAGLAPQGFFRVMR